MATAQDSREKKLGASTDEAWGSMMEKLGAMATTVQGLREKKN